MSRIKIVLGIILFLGITNPVWCRGALPEFYPGSFENEGILQKIKNGGGTLIINATAYDIGGNAKVHALNNNFASVNTLRKDMELGFILNDAASKRKVITEIWILPKGYVELD
ncbi:MAG: hypothetical protein P8X88_00405 [Gammaproteobacteria bacterium]